MEELNIKALTDEIKSLNSIASFGGLRLDELNNRLKALEIELANITTHDQILTYINSLKQFQNAIHASQEAVFDWKVKIEKKFKQLHDFAKSPLCKNHAELMKLSTMMTDLMKTFTRQLSLLQQQTDKSNNLLESAQRKKKALVATFERGKAPVLGIEDDEWVIV